MILILGGAKSGKTAYAENAAAELALKNNGRVIYLASAQAWDDEMKLRIKRHRESRPENWITLEETLSVPEKILEFQAKKGDVILFDCLTLWLTNLLMELGDDFKQIEAEELISRRVSDFIKALDDFPGEIIVVSNLVEQGLVSPNFLGRIFQELCGRSHQTLAASASEVYHVIAGLAQRLK
ncbi:MULTISPECIES: bifunctional adenosylcobinamide kinase/adenosylcobinamide-phosphate guanylyltransferase [unclassified Oceanispirochaeta]|uniref:bifunctional adenosylcobinamide kinase/adenosylcobinamide-phosphate guanylyltransferase n=1 Tax=unclassified Oceanispirochaeta TaxID=2635722 RepID=UPI000E092EFC|nr:MULTISPECIES: bifunctional adenosylcobinamide kinase/adenosylcobinamide-phosphate guanylyltransferase [unclassified Oceanispirochaeta]MBF9017649.1 bifunctional adenosylcobinamide kinase/adenosylcobinamide-phosphate guanylyltransferase [Oceanispirochaeta sp. M2]NPD74221.1 bifunctional adenosylcobinamide kinase/adenosylcobinamide-phosphate guanylyltransferase [Oceanispirochaeta sp. M1]RDG29927.1 bifunctional adenosylcobinamide kinase/adenosylcobinamide-phosphate guanylyltransferase [Oceanispiro